MSSAANIERLTETVRRLGPLAEQMVFVGGSTTALFITDAAAADVRETLCSPDLTLGLLPTLSSMRTLPTTRYVESAVAGGRPLHSQLPVSSAEIERPERCMTVSDWHSSRQESELDFGHDRNPDGYHSFMPTFMIY